MESKATENLDDRLEDKIVKHHENDFENQQEEIKPQIKEDGEDTNKI